MKRTFADLFGGVLAGILLLLYAVTVLYMIVAVIGSWQADPGKVLEFSSGLVSVVTTIGGLVSALVIAILAITPPGESPSIGRSSARVHDTQDKSNTVLAQLYLAVWLLVGLGALVVGVMLYPSVNQTLRDIGTTWLGLGVASGYAYFGIKPKT